MAQPHPLTGYREARYETRGKRILKRETPTGVLYYVGFGQWADDIEAAIRYDSDDANLQSVLQRADVTAILV